jgi:coenzyme F420 biosynthesis associated uncharacterized protein
VDWRLAGAVARALAGSGSGRRSVGRADLQRASRGCSRLVGDYTGLEPRRRLPAIEVVDREGWIEANLEGMRSLSSALERSSGPKAPLPGPLASGLRHAVGAAMGVELGIVSGILAQRVLGQYDVALLGPARPARLIFVAPNLAEAQRSLGVPRRPFLRWIALHETTHVVQFGAVPWLREHIGGTAERLLASSVEGISGRELVRLARSLLTPDPRRLVAAVRRGDWLTPFVGRPQVRLLRRLQASMALVEGYSEHVMDAVAADLGPEYDQLRDRLDRRRAERGLSGALIGRLLGLDTKLRQYSQGKAFCDEVVARRGIAVLNRAWSEPAALPRPSELERPGRWLSRVGGLRRA